MEDYWLWYLSGSFDTNGKIKVQISKNDTIDISYQIRPMLLYSRPKEADPVLGMIDEYAEEVDSAINFVERDSRIRIEIDNSKNIRNFLEPLVGGFIQQRERAEFFLDEFLPAFDGTTPKEKEKFMELVELADQLRGYPIQTHTTKYGTEYFQQEWRRDLSQ